MTAAGTCTDLETLSSFLGFAPQHIFYLVETADSQYLSISIPKHSDPTQLRSIDIPHSELKGVQRAINAKILSQFGVSDQTHSYIAGRSILTAAREFCPGKAVLRQDLRDFFPSITFPRVIGLFKSLGFNNSVSFILARLTTMNSRIAQGAPTSPSISNLIVRNLDGRLHSLAEKWEVDYLRYSDDLFFFKEKNFNHPRLAEVVSEMVGRSGFQVNAEKTRYLARGCPRITLGLLTHGEKPVIPGPQRRKYRSLFFRASRDVHWAFANRQILTGILEWYKSVHGRDETYLQYRAVANNISRLRIHDSYRSK